MAPVGTLADFLEVSGEHEGVVDEFLREELNYVVVDSWRAAEQGVNLLKSGVDGRATFLIHPEGHPGPAGSDSWTRAADPISGFGLTPLKDTIKVLNGFGRSLEGILPKLKHGYLVEDSGQAQQLSSRYSEGILPYAGRRVLPQHHGDGRQAGQRRPAGAQARSARNGEEAGRAGGVLGRGRGGSSNT